MGSEGSEPERADDDADKNETKDRADMQAMKHRDDNAGGAEDDERVLIERDVERAGFHPESLAVRVLPYPPERQLGCPPTMLSKSSMLRTLSRALALQYHNLWLAPLQGDCADSGGMGWRHRVG
jgi:hypothetical protein